jgi:hypothetical protein
VFRIIQKKHRPGISAELLKSLFCGLPRLEYRVAVFIAASDESSERHHDGQFYYGGVVAPVTDWWDWFAPAWEERVLNGPPKIPYLHMTDINSSKFLREHGLTEVDAQQRIDEALRVILSMGSLDLVTSCVNEAFFRDSFLGIRFRNDNRSPENFKPDYLCFLAYAYTVLDRVHVLNPTAEKVDFYVERNGRVSMFIGDFIDDMKQIFLEMKRPEVAALIGACVPVEKDRVPEQAADILCWHARRAKSGLTPRIARRYMKFAQCHGAHHEWTRDEITDFANRARNGFRDDEAADG